MNMLCSLAQLINVNTYVYDFMFMSSFMFFFSALRSSVFPSFAIPPVCTSCNGTEFFKESWMFRNYKRYCNMKYIYDEYCALLFGRIILSNKDIRV